MYYASYFAALCIMDQRRAEAEARAAQREQAGKTSETPTDSTPVESPCQVEKSA